MEIGRDLLGQLSTFSPDRLGPSRENRIVAIVATVLQRFTLDRCLFLYIAVESLAQRDHRDSISFPASLITKLTQCHLSISFARTLP